MILPSKIKFADEKLKNAYEELGRGRAEDKQLFGFLNRAFSDVEANAFCGIPVPKELIPKEYKRKYKIDNLWKYNLPNAWRLLYSVERQDVIVVSIVLEWLKHASYSRKFGYKKK